MPRCSLGLGLSPSIGVSVASGDFTNIATANAADGVYTLNGNTVSIEDLIEGTSPTSFDPADVDEGGLFCPEADPGNYSARYLQLKDPLKSQLLASGFTVVWEFYAAEFVGLTLSLNGGGLTAEVSSTNQGPLDLTYVYDPPNGDYYAESSEVYPALGQVNKVAASFTETGLAISVNGSGPLATAGGTGLDPAFTDIQMMFNGKADERLRSFAFYEPVDDADLPALSSL